MYEHICEMVSAGRYILAENQDFNVIRKQGEAVAGAGIGHRKIIVTQEFTACYESAKHLDDVTRKRTLPYFASFRLFLYHCPLRPLYGGPFSNIIAYPVLSRFAIDARENPRNKVASF